MRLPYPPTDVTPVRVGITQGIDRSGAPKVILDYVGKCTFSEKARYIRDPDGKLIQLEGSVHIKGDIAPGVSLVEGNVTVGGRTYKIYKSSRPRNPDGTVHHTKLELI